MPSALPENELPLYPEADCIGVATKNPDSGSWDTDAALISVIVDGHKKNYQVWGDKAEDLVSFQLRTDGWTHASVQFFGKQNALDVFSSAVVLVPNKESLERWTKYYAKRVAWARECAAYSAAQHRGPADRAYPSNVLPPK